MHDDDTTRDPREIAAEWHGGQTSDLYAFTSSGTILPGAYLEPDRELRRLPADHPDRAELEQLREHLYDLDPVRAVEHHAQGYARGRARYLTQTDARAALAADEADPAYSVPNLSGEWADDPTPEDLPMIAGMMHPDQQPAWIVDELAQVWEEAAAVAWRDELERIAYPTAAGRIAADVAREPFAWPGGYDRYAVTDDGGYLCATCCREEAATIADSDPGDGWHVVGADSTATADLEPVTCDHCYRTIYDPTAEEATR